MFVSTREKLHRDKQHTSGDILRRVKEQNISARRTFELSPSNWRTPYNSGILKESAIFRPKSRGRMNSGSGTPRGGVYGRIMSHKPKDLEAYKMVLADLDSRDKNFSMVDKSRIQARSPIFNRSEPIQRSIMKDQSSIDSIIEQLQRHRRKKPDVITIEDDIAANRPEISQSKDDREVVEILSIVSPRKSPKSPKKAKSPVNTLAAELECLDVYKPDFLDKLKQKYDIRRQDRDVLIGKKLFSIRFIISVISFHIFSFFQLKIMQEQSMHEIMLINYKSLWKNVCANIYN